MDLPGPDGFLLSPDDPLRAAHLRLNDYLLAEEQRDTARAPFDTATWRKLPKREMPGLVKAVLRRLAWLHQHDTDLENAHLARIRLSTLLRFLYSIKFSLTEPELRSLLDLTTPLLGLIAPYGPVERVVDYLKADDLTPELYAALRDFQAHLREEMSVSQASMQSLRQQLHMLLWMDEWEPLDPARCWSECVRRDFRAMEGERRVKWRKLLKHLRGNAPVRMPAGWARDAEPLLAAVGLEDFREHVHVWFAPFRSGEALPLSVPGSHVLKCLIWFCAISGDDGLKDCALWLLNVKWKQKRNSEKSMIALGVFGISKEDLRARSLIPAEPPAPGPRLIEKIRQAVCPQPGNHIQIDPDGDLIVVQGQLHFYRLFRSTRRIERVTDGAVLDLDWPAISDQWRMFLHRECDSDRQLNHRAHMLMNDALFGRFFAPTKNT